MVTLSCFALDLWTSDFLTISARTFISSVAISLVKSVTVMGATISQVKSFTIMVAAGALVAGLSDVAESEEA